MVALTLHKQLKIPRGRCVQYLLRWGGKTYVGSSTNFNSRMGWWISHFRRVGVSLEGVAVEPLLFCEHQDRAYYEENLIRILLPGHNKTRDGKAGGALGRKLSEATIEKIRAGNVGRVVSEESRKKMSEAARRRPPMSEEHRLKISVGNIGKTLSHEARAKVSAAVKGVPKSEAHRAALRAAWIRRKEKQQCI